VVEHASARDAVHRDIMHGTTGAMDAIPSRALIMHAMSYPLDFRDLRGVCRRFEAGGDGVSV
jgi:hypothetical protein